MGNFVTIDDNSFNTVDDYLLQILRTRKDEFLANISDSTYRSQLGDSIDGHFVINDSTLSDQIEKQISEWKKTIMGQSIEEILGQMEDQNLSQLLRRSINSDIIFKDTNSSLEKTANKLYRQFLTPIMVTDGQPQYLVIENSRTAIGQLVTFLKYQQEYNVRANKTELINDKSNLEAVKNPYTGIPIRKDIADDLQNPHDKSYYGEHPLHQENQSNTIPDSLVPYVVNYIGSHLRSFASTTKYKLASTSIRGKFQGLKANFVKQRSQRQRSAETGYWENQDGQFLSDDPNYTEEGATWHRVK